VERAQALARHHRRFRRLGGGERAVRGDGDEGPELGIEGGDAVEVRLRNLDGRYLSARDGARELADGPPHEFGHAALLRARGSGWWARRRA
jgi:hypothetical protein